MRYNLVVQFMSRCTFSAHSRNDMVLLPHDKERLEIFSLFFFLRNWGSLFVHEL